MSWLISNNGLRRYRAFGGLLALMVGVSATIAAQEADDLKKLQGTWVVVSTISADPKEAGVGYLFKFDENTWQILNPLGKRETGMHEIKLRPKQNPKEIDIIFSADSVIHGIYAFEKNQLKVCWGPHRNRPRPKEFAADKRDEVRVFVLERKQNK